MPTHTIIDLVNNPFLETDILLNDIQAGKLESVKSAWPKINHPYLLLRFAIWADQLEIFKYMLKNSQNSSINNNQNNVIFIPANREMISYKEEMYWSESDMEGPDNDEDDDDDYELSEDQLRSDETKMFLIDAIYHNRPKFVKFLIEKNKIKKDEYINVSKPQPFSLGEMELGSSAVLLKVNNSSPLPLNYEKKMDAEFFGLLQPIHIASYFGRTEIVKYMVERFGINPTNSIDPSEDENNETEEEINDFVTNSMYMIIGKTPIYLAAERNHLSLTEYLLECEVDPDEPLAIGPQAGDCPLHTAVENNNLEIVNCLINKGNVDFQKIPESGPNAGFTPLQIAVREGNKDIIFILIANIEKCIREQFPEKQELIAKEIIRAINLPNQSSEFSGKTALDFAINGIRNSYENGEKGKTSKPELTDWIEIIDRLISAGGGREKVLAQTKDIPELHCCFENILDVAIDFYIFNKSSLIKDIAANSLTMPNNKSLIIKRNGSETEIVDLKGSIFNEIKALTSYYWAGKQIYEPKYILDLSKLCADFARGAALSQLGFSSTPFTDKNLKAIGVWLCDLKRLNEVAFEQATNPTKKGTYETFNENVPVEVRVRTLSEPLNLNSPSKTAEDCQSGEGSRKRKSFWLQSEKQQTETARKKIRTEDSSNNNAQNSDNHNSNLNVIDQTF